MSCEVVYKQWFEKQADPDSPLLNSRHVHYFATRPGAIYNKGCGFGLWGKLPGDDTPRVQNDLVKAERCVIEISKTRTMYRGMISVKGETALEHGLYHRERWEQLVNNHISVIAKQMDIKSENFFWVASFHCAKGHPHVHVAYWDAADQPRPEFIPEPQFSRKMERIRAEFAGEINREEIRDTQQEQRSQTKALRTALQAMCLEANPEKTLDIPRLHKSELLEGLSADMAELIQQLPTKGSLRYAYLPPEYKELLHSFIDKCLEQPELQKELLKYEKLTNTISELYANGEESKAANWENARKKLYKELGNEVMDAMRGIRDELPAKSQTAAHTGARSSGKASGDSLRDALGHILPHLDSYQKLLTLLPAERIPLDRMDAQIPGYREQLSLVVADVLSDARLRPYLQSRSPEAPDGEPFPDSGGTAVTDGKWADVEELFREEIESIYMQELPDSVTENAPDTAQGNGSGQGQKQNWWTEEYKEARRFFYGTKAQPPDLEKAFTLMQAEANKGNGFAMHDLGKMYLSGLGCEKDQERAQAWFRAALDAFVKEEAAAARKDYFQYRIGRLYAFGYGVEQDYPQAAAWYEKAVSADNPFAAYSLGSLYSRGQGVQQDHAKAYALYQMAAEHSKKPNAYAAYELGRMCRNGIGTAPDRAASDSWCRKAYEGFLTIESNMADDKLYYRLGQMNLNGIGTEVDLIQAKQYFEKAAKLNNSDALYGLGQLYLRKESEDYDPSKAVECLTEAAQKGHGYAQYMLGKLFLQGDEVPQDVDTALQWLEAAVGNENEHAEYLLGRLLLTGEDVEQDLPRAEELLKKAADKGNSHAQYALGRTYLYGDVLEPDIEEGVRLLTEAAEQNHDYAQYTLGKLLIQGEEVPQDVDIALGWLEKAVGNENEHAEYLLGKLLLTGEDVEQDLPRAEELLKKAADKGNSHAQYTLGRAYLYGDPLEQNIEEGIRLLTEAANRGNEYAQNAIDRYIIHQVRQDAGWQEEAVRTCTTSSLMSMMGTLSRLVGQRQATVSQAALRKLQSKDKSREAKKDARAKQAFSSVWGNEL